MSKCYPTKEIDSNKSMNGIKNIIGIKVTHKKEILFYSILDDCFFRIIPAYEELANNYENYAGICRSLWTDHSIF